MKPNSRPFILSDLDDDALLTTQEVGETFRLSPGYLRNLRCAGRAPRAIRIGRSVKFRLRDVRSWLNSLAEPEQAETNTTTES